MRVRRGWARTGESISLPPEPCRLCTGFFCLFPWQRHGAAHLFPQEPGFSVHPPFCFCFSDLFSACGSCCLSSGSPAAFGPHGVRWRHGPALSQGSMLVCLSVHVCDEEHRTRSG